MSAQLANADSAAYLSVAETARHLRRALKLAFPEVVFSVKSHRHSGGGSIDVGWLDGPARAEVEKITHGFADGGFDGMIDMAYSVEHWLLPSGDTQVAYSPGTEGSRGMVPAIPRRPKPDPKAMLVRFGAKFVFANRRVSADTVDAS